MTGIDYLGLLVFTAIALLIGSVIFELPKRSRTLTFTKPLLVFQCEPSTDTEITCIFCARPVVDLEYIYRTHDQTVTAGIHAKCLDNPRHLALSPEQLCELVQLQ